MQDVPSKRKGRLSSTTLTRRSFLLRASAISVLTFAGGTGAFLFFRRPSPGQQENGHTVVLSDQDLDALASLAECLVPDSHGLPRQDFSGLILSATSERADRLADYRLAARLLDHVANREFQVPRFSKASRDTKNAIVESLAPRYSAIDDSRLSGKLYLKSITLWDRMVSPSRWRFREYVVRDILRRYYAGHVVWAMIGYSNYPGVPGDPREYTRAGVPFSATLGSHK